MGSFRWPLAPPGVLPAGYRTQPRVPQGRLYGGWSRRMFRRAYVRDAPGQGFFVEQSIFQPVNIPGKQQVDIALEYTHSNAVMPGVVGYLERTPYLQGRQGQSTMQPRQPGYNYNLQAPRFSTLPTIFGVGMGG